MQPVSFSLTCFWQLLSCVALNNIPKAEEVRSLYKDFEPRVQRLLQLADPDGFRYWPMGDLDELPTWHKNRTVIIGDAAHPVVPFGFAGAAMAIEDATTLGVLFNQFTPSSAVEERLSTFENLRKPRVGHVREQSRVLATGKGDFKGYLKWLSEYDVVAEAEVVM